MRDLKPGVDYDECKRVRDLFGDLEYETKGAYIDIDNDRYPRWFGRYNRHLSEYYSEAMDALRAISEPEREGLDRLADWPENLREKAVAFLDAHDAWDTEFTAKCHVTEGQGGTGELWWQQGNPHCRMTFRYYVDTDGPSRVYLWGSYADGDFYLEVKGYEVRRSEDFAAFVRRYKTAVVAGGNDR